MHTVNQCLSINMYTIIYPGIEFEVHSTRESQINK